MHMQIRKFIDMFSGAGLFSEAGRQAGLEPTFAIDVSSDAIRSYNRNIAEVGVVGSVLDDRKLPEADVLIAGPPCQGFSTLGRRDPKDERSALSLAVLRWAEIVRPSVVVVENVPPFLRSTYWQRLARGFQAQGFSVQAWELEAADFGAPQHRRRAFTIASRVGDLVKPLQGKQRKSAREVFSHPIKGGDPMHTWPEPSNLAARRFALIPPKGDKRDVMQAAPELCPPSWERVGCHATDVWGRIDPDRPSNTIRCTFQNPSKGRYIHPTEDRVISLREAARLQGVPDDWVFVGKPYPIARQIGNGVPVQLGRAVMQSVASKLGVETTALLAA